MNFVSKLGFLKRKTKKQNVQSETIHLNSNFDQNKLETDTNIFSIDLITLKEKDKIWPGKPTKCSNCDGVFNMYSTLEDKTWNCEFCFTPNKTSLEPEEIPKCEDMNYLIKSAKMLEFQNQGVKKGGALIFCIDMSGSMSFSTQIIGKKNYKNAFTQDEIEMLKGFLEPGVTMEMYMAELGQMNGNVSHITRKQCVIAAIESQIQELLKKDKTKKIGLVTFNSEVNVIGDGYTDPFNIAGDRLYKESEIIEFLSTKTEQLLQNPIEKSSENLLLKLGNSKEEGKTSLGPALLASLELAIKQGPGTSILICTDGLANVGLGALDIEGGFLEQSVSFYDKIGEKAKENGITINLLTIRGEACKTEVFSKLVDLTNGNIARVDPEKIEEDFLNILKDEIIATEVEVTLKISNYLQFRNEEKENISQDGSLCVRKIGNATTESKISFEYELKSDEELQKLQVDPEKIKRTFFQANIKFKDMEGNLILKSISKFQETTGDIVKAQSGADLKLLNNHCARATTSKVQSQNLFGANEYNANWRNYMEEVATQNNSGAQQKIFSQEQKKIGKMAVKKSKARKSNISGNKMEEELKSNNSLNLSEDEDINNYSEDELEAKMMKGKRNDLFK